MGNKKQEKLTLQKKRFSIRDFFHKYEQIHSFHSSLWIWLHLMKKSLMKNVIFCAVKAQGAVMSNKSENGRGTGKLLLWPTFAEDGLI